MKLFKTVQDDTALLEHRLGKAREARGRLGAAIAATQTDIDSARRQSPELGAELLHPRILDRAVRARMRRSRLDLREANANEFRWAQRHGRPSTPGMLRSIIDRLFGPRGDG